MVDKTEDETKDWIDVLAEDSGTSPDVIKQLRNALREEEVYHEKARGCRLKADMILKIIRANRDVASAQRIMREFTAGQYEGLAKIKDPEVRKAAEAACLETQRRVRQQLGLCGPKL